MSGLGVLNPVGALALVGVAILVALHLLQRRRRVTPVATLFLWRQIPARPRPHRRFHVDALFLLQLVLLLALVAGLVRPYVEGAAAAPRAAALQIVLDVSASMQTRERGGTRFELARRRAAGLLARLGRRDAVMVLTAADRAHVLERWTTDHVRVRRRLETLEPLDTPTSLGPALLLALGEADARPGTRTVVLTDLPPEASGVPADRLAEVDYVQIGRTDDNLAIAGITVEAPPFRALAETTATIAVRNYGREARRTVLAALVGGEPWAWHTLEIEPRATEHVTLVHPPREGVLAVELHADDALAVDDHALAWIADGQPLDLLLVSDSQELTAAFAEVVAAIAGSRVEVMSRARYDATVPAGRRVALFDGFVPTRVPPAVNALYVAPPSGNTLCPSTGTLAGATVIDWDDHPALAGLDGLQAIATERTSRLGRPTWATPIVVAAAEHVAFPFLLAGERGGRRLACLAAELTGPLASSDRLPLLMLTLGTLRWLGEPYAGSARVIETGRAVLAGPGPRAPIDGPGGGAGLRLAGNPPVLLAERAGVYRLGTPGGERLVLANLFDEQESDVGRAGPATWRARSGDAREPPVRPREVGWWLYLLAAALLGTEWVVWRRRERRGA